MRQHKEEIRISYEKRMYFFVPYNISPIQQAIQAGHAAVEYALQNGRTQLFIDFAKNWKTWIILNGGTTNNKVDNEFNHYLGTLNQLEDEIIKFNYAHRKDNTFIPIEYANFHEPDLNDALTAVCFICDERVFNYEDHPQFPEWIYAQEMEHSTKDFINRAFITPITSDEECERILPEYFIQWKEVVLGGEKNYFLRQLLKGKKLA